MNFEVTQKGPLIPPGVNQKSFYSFSIAKGDTKDLKAGQVLKCTNGKIRMRNKEESKFTNNNSLYAEKGDIVAIKGNVVAQAEDDASFRVFTADKK